MTGLSAVVSGLDVLGVWSKIKGAAGAVLAWLVANPLAGLLAVSLLANGWQYHEHGETARALASAQAENAKMVSASKQALAQAEARNAAIAAQSKENANAADQYHDQLVQSSSALADYISAHRVRPSAGASDSGTVSASAQGGGSGVSASAAPAPSVAVDDSTLKTCDADYDYAQAAYVWASGMKGVGQ